MATQLKHLGIIFLLDFVEVWILHMVQNHAHLRSSDAFSAQGGKKTHRNVNENDWRPNCIFGGVLLWVMPFYQSWIWVWKSTNPKSWSLGSIPEMKKPALEVLRCRSLSLNDEWICMNYWLMWIHFRWIFLTSSGHLQKYDKVLVVDTCNRKEPWWTNTSAPSFQIWTYPDTFWPSTHLNKI